MLLKTILFEDGVQIEIICDPEKPLWDQEIKVTGDGQIVASVPESPSGACTKGVQYEK